MIFSSLSRRKAFLTVLWNSKRNCSNGSKPAISTLWLKQNGHFMIMQGMKRITISTKWNFGSDFHWHERSLLPFPNLFRNIKLRFLSKFFVVCCTLLFVVFFWSALASKSGFNLFNSASLPSQTALWFINKFDEKSTKTRSRYYCAFWCGNQGEFYMKKIEANDSSIFNSLKQAFTETFIEKFLSNKIPKGFNESTHFVYCCFIVNSQPAQLTFIFF